MPDQFYQITTAAPKAEQMTAQRVMLQHLLYAQRQRRKAAPHVCMSGRQPNLDPRSHRKRVHLNVSRPQMSRSRTCTSTSRPTITCRPFALTTSMRPWSLTGGGTATVAAGGVSATTGSATTMAGTKSFVERWTSRPSRAALRQAFNCQRVIPCRCAVAVTCRAVMTLSHNRQLCFIRETPATPAIHNLHPAEMPGEIACDVHDERTVYIAVYIDRAFTRSLTSAMRPCSDAYFRCRNKGNRREACCESANPGDHQVQHLAPPRRLALMPRPQKKWNHIRSKQFRL